MPTDFSSQVYLVTTPDGVVREMDATATKEFLMSLGNPVVPQIQNDLTGLYNDRAGNPVTCAQKLS